MNPATSDDFLPLARRLVRARVKGLRFESASARAEFVEAEALSLASLLTEPAEERLGEVRYLAEEAIA